MIRLIDSQMKLNFLKLKTFFFLLLLLIVLILLGCKQGKDQDFPKAITGTLDLENWDFESRGELNLDGSWEFYNQQLLTPTHFKSEQPKKMGYIKVPKKWEDTDIQGEKITGMGFGTYRLRLLLKNQKDLSLKMKTIGTAYKLYVNETLICQSGQVGESMEVHRPDWNPDTFSIGPISGEVFLLVQVSNFSIHNGGLWDSIQLGEKNKIHLLREIGISRDTFLGGSLFIIAIYHISIFYFRRIDISSFLFGILCINMSMRSFLTGEIVLKKIFSEVPWSVYANIEYLTFFIAIPIFIIYFRSCFPEEFNLWIFRFLTITSYTICTIVILTPIDIYTILLRPMQIIAIISSIYIIYVIILAAKKNREGANVFIVGVVLFSITVFNDFLHNFKIINTGYYNLIGLYFFIFSQSYLLSKKTSLAFARVEELSESLEKKVLQRTEELSKERDRLIEANLKIATLSESRKRLSLIGQMASGIVHDIKNPMSTIKSFAELVRGGNLSKEEKEEYMGYISREIDRMSDMTYEILDFSKGNIQLLTQKEKISQLLMEIYEFLKMDFKHTQIELTLEIQEDFEVEFDRDRIRRVILNIANNAKEEMSDGEKEYSFKIKSYIENSYGIISFKDNGHGLRDEIKQKIFEPYITEGKDYGTGLGLFMCKQIIEAHHGSITYDTIFGEGTIFFIKLPIINII